MSPRTAALQLVRLLLWLVTAAIVVALALGVTAGGTARAARALSWIEPRLLLEHTDGNLLNARFSAIRWRDAGLAVELHDVSWRLSPRCLLSDILCLESLEIGTADIDTGNAPGDPGPLSLAPLALPVEIVIENARLRSLKIHHGPETLPELRDIAMRAEIRDSRIDIARIAFTTESIGVTLSGRLGLRDQLPMALSGHLAGEPEYRADFTVAGDLARLSVRARTAGLLALDLDARANVLARPPSVELGVRSREPIAWPAGGDAVATLREATLSVSGTPAGLHAALAGRMDSVALGANRLDVTAAWTPGMLEVAALRLSGDAGALDASGTLALGATKRWRLSAKASDFCPVGWAPALRCALNGDTVAEGVLAAGRGELAVTTALEGTVNGHPARIAGRASALPGQHWQIDQLDLRSGANTLQVNGVYGERMDLQATLDIGNLADTLANAAGSGRGTLALRGTAGAPEASGSLHLEQLAWQGVQAATADLQLEWRGLARAGNRIRLALREARADGVEDITLDAALDGTGPSHTLAVQARAAGATLVLGCTGGLEQDFDWNASCADLHGQAGDADRAWAADRALRLAWRHEARVLRVDPICLRQDDATLCSQQPARLGAGQFGGIVLAGKAIPLAWAQRWLAPGVHAAGELDLQFSAQKSIGKPPRIDARVLAAQLSLSALTAGEPLPLSITGLDASLHASDGTAALDWRLALNGSGDFSGHITLAGVSGAGALSGTMALRDLDLAPLAQGAPGLISAAGVLAGSLKLAGSPREPLLAGELGIRGIRFAHERLAQPVTDASLAIGFSGSEARLEGRFTTAGGSVNLYGPIDFGATDWRADLRLQATALQLEPLRDSSLTVTPDLRIVIDPRHAEISGELFVPAADIRLDRLPDTALSVSPDTVIVGAPVRDSPFEYSADIRLRLGDAVRLHGRGVDARLAGSLDISKRDAEALQARGEILVPEGRYTAYGQRLEVTEGSLRFRGPIDRPGLRLTAVRRIEDENVVVGVRVRGDASSPELSTFSRPAMEEERALHYLLTGRAPEPGGNMDLAITTAMMQLGVAGASKVTGKVMQNFGIQDFQVATRQVDGGTEVHLSGYLSADLYLRYGVSTLDRINTFRLRYRLSRSVYVEAISGIENAVDFLYSFER